MPIGVQQMTGPSIKKSARCYMTDHGALELAAGAARC